MRNLLFSVGQAKTERNTIQININDICSIENDLFYDSSVNIFVVGFKL